MVLVILIEVGVIQEVVIIQEVLVEAVLRLLHRHLLIIIILVSIIQLILMIQVSVLLIIISMQIHILVVEPLLMLLEMLDTEYLLGEVKLIIQ
mgnify:CR=1 FL=1